MFLAAFSLNAAAMVMFADAYWQHKSVTSELGDPNEERDRQIQGEVLRLQFGAMLPPLAAL
jgi:hypothetical protein